MSALPPHPRAPRTPRIPPRVLDNLTSGLEHELQQVAVLNIPKGLGEHDPEAARKKFEKEMNEPIIAVHGGVLHVNGVPQPSGMISITGLLKTLREQASAQGGARKSKRTKKTT